MKPSERSQAYVIGALAILLTSLAFLLPPLLRGAGDPGDLHFIGWYMLTVLCLAAIGELRSQAHLRKNKWLLLFAVPPLALLTYEAWFILRRLWASLWVT